MKSLRALPVLMALVVAACGGGADDATTTVAAVGDSTGVTTTTAATTTAAPTTVDPGSGATTDFCAFVEEYAENVNLSPVGMSPAEFEEAFRANLAAIDQAAQIAPSEIRGDVELFASAFGGFIELLEEYNFNFLAMDEAAQNDPRLKALEDPELEAAGDRIEEFCGFEDGDFIQTPRTGGGNGSTVPPTQTLPESFPTDLVPPGGTIVATVDIAGVGTSVTFDVESPVDDVIAYYTGVVGAPTAELPEPKGALWTGAFEGGMLNIVASETGPGMTQVNVTFR